MIYSFLSQEFNQKLEICPDFSYERESRGNTFDFYVREGVFIAEEYEGEDLVKEIKITLNKGDHIVADSMSSMSSRTLNKLFKVGVKVSLLKASNMIHSFLDQEFNEKLGINPDFSYEREYQGNTFEFYLMEGVFIAEEYEGEDLVKEIKITLNKGDHIVADSMSSMSSRTLNKLFKVGVKVSLLNSELTELPLEEETEN